MINKNENISSKTFVQFKYFFIISTAFSATWLISNIAAVKLVSIFGLTLTGGFFIFPFTATLSSIIVEIYGYKNARQAIWGGVLLNLLFLLFINLVSIIPASPYWKLQVAFNSILVPSTRIIVASLISFLLSDFSNSYLMAKMKIKSNGKSLIKRILIAYTLSISVDIIFFMFLSFTGTMPISLLMQLTIAAYCKKMFCQIAFFPIIWYLIGSIKKWEGVEIYDYDTKFNPFSIDNIYEFTAYKKIDKNSMVEKSTKLKLDNIEC